MSETKFGTDVFVALAAIARADGELGADSGRPSRYDLAALRRTVGERLRQAQDARQSPARS